MMFQRILSWIREALNKMLNLSSIKQAIRLDVAITPFMREALQKWSLMYVNQSPWLGGDVKSLNLPASIASEVSKTVTLEMVVEVSGSPRGDFLNEQLKPVLENIRTYTEYASAKGGLMFKPYIKGDSIAMDYVQADMFSPISFDSNGNMTACVFVDQKQIANTFYTRLEYHALIKEGYQILNTCWRSTTRDVLGTQVPLSNVTDWAELKEEAFIKGITKPLFAYFKMPMANNIDPASPLGVSIYSRAVDLIEQADRQWSGLLWEFESSRRAVYTTPEAFAKGADGKPVLPDKRLYRLLDLAALQIDKPGFFEDFTPTIRELNFINGLETMYRLIEFQCGLAEGCLPRPAALQFATATEIKSTKQSYYVTVTDIQKSLKKSLNDLLYAMDTWLTAYNETYGTNFPIGTYAATYKFDDSIISDHDTQFMQDTQTVTLGAMPKYVLLMRNYGLSEADAKKWVAESQAEAPAPFFPSSESLV